MPLMDVAKWLMARGSWLLGGVIMAKAVGQLPTKNLFEIGVAFHVPVAIRRSVHRKTLSPNGPIYTFRAIWLAALAPVRRDRRPQ